MSIMTDKMSKAERRPGSKAAVLPKRGDHYRCQTCGMEFEITTDCNCKGPDHAHFECCGQDMKKQ